MSFVNSQKPLYLDYRTTNALLTADIEDEAASLIPLFQGLVFFVCNRLKNFDWNLVRKAKKKKKKLILDNRVLARFLFPGKRNPFMR